eukprot:scaffold515047_cov46-Prasinocladus_malaysianus.AAC.2
MQMTAFVESNPNLHMLDLLLQRRVTDKGMAAVAGPPTAGSLIASGDALGGISLALGGLMSSGTGHKH